MNASIGRLPFVVEAQLEGVAQADLLGVVDNELVVLQRVALGVVDASRDTTANRDLTIFPNFRHVGPNVHCTNQRTRANKTEVNGTQSSAP
jgi:hypothetical protein